MARVAKKKIEIRPAETISEELPGEPLPGFDTDKAFKEEGEKLNEVQIQEIRRLKIQNDVREGQSQKIKDDNEARKLHSGLIFLLVFIWLITVLVIIILNGARVLNLSDKVIITLLSTTSINVIGLLVIVANYLFNKNKST